MKFSRMAMLVAAFAVWFGSSLGLHSATAAETPKPAPAADVALNDQGTLSGTLVDTQGKPLAAKKVVLSQGRKELAIATTNNKGQFEIKNVKGGVYQVSEGNQGALVRAWTSRTAPPNAKKQTVLISGGNRIVRAQGDFGDMGAGGVLGAVGLAAGGAGLGLAISNAGEVSDLKKQNEQLQQQINQLNNTP